MKHLLLSFSQFFYSRRDLGLLIFRIGLGGMFMWHGFPKVTGGEDKWLELGHAMGTLGIHFAPAFWGFMAGAAEFFGGLCFLLGLFYRPVCVLLMVNMSVAFSSQMLEGKGLLKAAQSLEDGFSLTGSLFVGPGIYSLDYLVGLDTPTPASPFTPDTVHN